MNAGLCDGPLSAFESKGSFIARVLRSEILEGTLAPGASLKQRDLARRFQVSPTPVREALSQLSAEGYVISRLHQGAVVLEAKERVAENWRLRAILEPLAAELATPLLADEDLDQIQALADAFAQASAEAAARANRDFHLAIYNSANSPVLLRFINELWKTLEVEPTKLRSHGDSVREHGAIVDALRKRNAERAADLVRQHVLGTAPE